MNVHSFGQCDGAPVFEATIASKAGASAKILTWGAVLRDLVVPLGQGRQRVTLGLNSIEDYVAHSPFFGAVPGRFANRIANGRFTLDGAVHNLAHKPGEKHTLHGGPEGFGRRVWKLGPVDASSATHVASSKSSKSPKQRLVEVTTSDAPPLPRPPPPQRRCRRWHPRRQPQLRPHLPSSKSVAL